MRFIFILAFAANLVLAVISLVLSPSTVAIHFGFGGEPDGWALVYVSALIMAGANGLPGCLACNELRLKAGLPELRGKKSKS
ncbi:MAG: DUF1648 domain-containing protein [Deltaproteobacteria bacterium]|nr:DUF1648 domain-containing protein [Deltaproteobacteria bacterium]